MHGKSAAHTGIVELRAKPKGAKVVPIAPHIERAKPEPERRNSLMPVAPKREKPWEIVVEHSADINRGRMDGSPIEDDEGTVVRAIQWMKPDESSRLRHYLMKISRESPYEQVRKAASKRVLGEVAGECAKTGEMTDELAEAAVNFNQAFGREDGKGRLRYSIDTAIGEIQIATLTEFTGVRMEKPGASFTMMGEYSLDYGRTAPIALSHCRAGYGASCGTKPDIVLTALSVALY